MNGNVERAKCLEYNLAQCLAAAAMVHAPITPHRGDFLWRGQVGIQRCTTLIESGKERGERNSPAAAAAGA